MKKYNNLLLLLFFSFYLLLPPLLNAQWLETTIDVGGGPWALVWNSADNKVYCANNNSDNITVIDGENNTVITTIPVGDQPGALVWNSFNNKVYCANRESNNVTVIDGQNDSVITTIPVGQQPSAFCWNSIQNRVYVANNGSSSISVIRDEVAGFEEYQTLNALSLTTKIFPNPARNYFTVRILPTTNCIKMFDVSGKLVKQIVLSSNQINKKQEMKVSLDDIKNGVYFIKTNNVNQVTKIIVTR